jgi:hypothetical protein
VSPLLRCLYVVLRDHLFRELTPEDRQEMDELIDHRLDARASSGPRARHRRWYTSCRSPTISSL